MSKKHDKRQGRKAKEPTFRSFSFVAFHEDDAPPTSQKDGVDDEGDTDEVEPVSEEPGPDSDALMDWDASAPGAITHETPQALDRPPASPRRGAPLEGRGGSPYAPDEATASPYQADAAEGTLDIEGEAAQDVAEIGPTEPLPISWGDELEPPSIPAPGGRPACAPEDASLLESRIQGLEQELDRLLRVRDGGPNRAAVPAASFARPPLPAPGPTTSGAEPPARATDEDGYDPAFEDSLLPALDFLCERYFRVEAIDVANVPARGRCLLVANHGGGRIPVDGLVLRSVLRLYHPSARSLRWLSEDAVHHLPFVGTRMARLGAVRACPENGERLLARGDLALVFPEGEKGLGKTLAERYRLQRFGRGGFIRLCLRTRSPIVPVAILGSEETPAVNVALDPLLRVLGVAGGPLARLAARGAFSWLPAPAKWRIRFGAPIRFDSYGPEAASDEVLVARLASDVRGRIQGMLDELARGRRGVFFG